MATTLNSSTFLAELLHRVGDVPSERIVTDPAPGTATIADCQRLCDGDAKRVCELVDGVLVEKTAAGVELVWYIDPDERLVEVFTAVDQKQTLRESDPLTGGTVLPGFQVSVQEIFVSGELRRPQR